MKKKRSQRGQIKHWVKSYVTDCFCMPKVFTQRLLIIRGLFSGLLTNPWHFPKVLFSCLKISHGHVDFQCSMLLLRQADNIFLASSLLLAFTTPVLGEVFKVIHRILFFLNTLLTEIVYRTDSVLDFVLFWRVGRGTFQHTSAVEKSNTLQCYHLRIRLLWMSVNPEWFVNPETFSQVYR